MPEFHPDFPSQIESEILSQICNQEPSEHLWISQFQRFGFSGAKLILIYFNEQAAGVPYLVKITTLDKITREKEAINHLRHVIEDCRVHFDRIFQANGTGGLVYPHFGTDRADEASSPVTLRERLFCEEVYCDIDRLGVLIDIVFEKLRTAHLRCSLTEVNIRDHYGDYIHRNIPGYDSRRCMEMIFGVLKEDDTFLYQGAQIFNPLIFERNLPTTILSPVGFVHGDLHPDNIVIDRFGQSHIIDYAWGGEPRDILVDYVLLENSVRFWHFPKYVNYEEQLEVDIILLEREGYSQIEAKHFSTPEATRYFKRLAKAISIIRTHANERLGLNFNMNHYLTVQFLLLFGVINIKEYNTLQAIRYLGLIAKKLSE